MTQPRTTLSAADLADWVRAASADLSEHIEELTALDAAIGDADHGSNMTRGFTAAVEALDAETLETPDAVLKRVAMSLISQIGGASGPLYGTLFLRMAAATVGRPELDAPALVEAVEAGVTGMVQRGRAKAGEKTMLDAWCPALDALRSGGAELATAVAAAADAAEHGRDATRDLVATKGRASYLGERSVGHIDPGAASTAIILRALEGVASGRGPVRDPERGADRDPGEGSEQS